MRSTLKAGFSKSPQCLVSINTVFVVVNELFVALLQRLKAIGEGYFRDFEVI